jgi:ABC-type glucose/galactose transport system permease subunit
MPLPKQRQTRQAVFAGKRMLFHNSINHSRAPHRRMPIAIPYVCIQLRHVFLNTRNLLKIFAQSSAHLIIILEAALAQLQMAFHTDN